MSRDPRSPVRSLALLCAALGCADAPDGFQYGRLDLVIRPSTAPASHQRLKGSFTIRGVARATRERITIDRAGHHTRGTWLRPGAYLLEWQDGVDLGRAQSLEGLGESARSAVEAEPQMAIVIGARVTTVHVWTRLAAPPLTARLSPDAQGRVHESEASWPRGALSALRPEQDP